MGNKKSPAGKQEFFVPAWVWWALGGIGLAVRFTFILKGNVAFNTDEAFASDYIKKKLSNDLGDFAAGHDFAGFRLAVACLFYWLTNGWVYFGSLAAVFVSGLFSVVWVSWVYRKVSSLAALGMAFALAFPPVAIAYYSTHFEERRIETLWWASLLVFFSGTWLQRTERALIFGLIVGWTYWCEPFILFFGVPVLLLEAWSLRQKLKQYKMKAVWIGAGLSVGLAAGFWWNCPFTNLGPKYLQWNLRDWGGMLRHFDLLFEAYPQFWNGNFPFGYLQNSELGRTLDPVLTGRYAGFLAFWTFSTFGLAILGFVFSALSRSKEESGCAWLGFAPAVFFFVFFLWSSQVWDATSFRYLSYWVIFASTGVGLVFFRLFRFKPVLGILFLALWVLVQGWILGERCLRLPSRHPAEVVAQNFKASGLKAGFANHWLAHAARYLSRDEVLLTGYTNPTSWRAWEAAHREKRVGCVVLTGLDRSDLVGQQIKQLEKEGYRPVREWPMVGNWSILEFNREQSIKEKP